MSVLTLASDPQDATALEGAEAHHARLAGELAGRVKMLLTAVDRREPSVAEKIHAGLVAFCDRSLLPHAAAEEAVLYPVAHGMPEARLLIESLLGEHRCLTALVAALRATPNPSGAAADARALQVLFEEHVAKENGLVLPLLAMTPEVSLAALLADMARSFQVRGVPAATTPTGPAGDSGPRRSRTVARPALLRLTDCRAPR
ncbi:hemerythrin domain-containing protein [Streptomyces sp. NPDC057438]|uniref:hemerythrin domain-containing protein n=1 Tax=Streptomyces sp. NPDC057438 TaxID=3346133 RepID=UPI0036B40F95